MAAYTIHNLKVAFRNMALALPLLVQMAVIDEKLAELDAERKELAEYTVRTVHRQYSPVQCNMTITCCHA
jgi:hypothetical protein